MSIYALRHDEDFYSQLVSFYRELGRSSEVEKLAHTSSGIRKKLIPGARMVMIVTRKFSAVAIDDAPANCTAMVKKDWPIGASTESGA